MQKLTDYVLIGEAAEVLRGSQNMPRSQTRDGKIPLHRNRARGYWLFRRSDLERPLKQLAKAA